MTVFKRMKDRTQFFAYYPEDNLFLSIRMDSRCKFGLGISDPMDPGMVDFFKSDPRLEDSNDQEFLQKWNECKDQFTKTL